MKNIPIWLAIIVQLLIPTALIGQNHSANYSDKDFTSFYQDMTTKKIKSAQITGRDLEWDDFSGKKFKTTIPPDGAYEIGKELKDNGATVKFEKSSNSSILSIFLSSWLPLIWTIGFALIFYALPIALTIWIVMTLRRMARRVEQIERLLSNRS